MSCNIGTILHAALPREQILRKTKILPTFSSTDLSFFYKLLERVVFKKKYHVRFLTSPSTTHTGPWKPPEHLQPEYYSSPDPSAVLAVCRSFHSPSPELLMVSLLCLWLLLLCQLFSLSVALPLTVLLVVPVHQAAICAQVSYPSHPPWVSSPILGVALMQPLC